MAGYRTDGQVRDPLGWGHWRSRRTSDGRESCRILCRRAGWFRTSWLWRFARPNTARGLACRPERGRSCRPWPRTDPRSGSPGAPRRGLGADRLPGTSGCSESRTRCGNRTVRSSPQPSSAAARSPWAFGEAALRADRHEPPIGGSASCTNHGGTRQRHSLRRNTYDHPHRLQHSRS